MTSRFQRFLDNNEKALALAEIAAALDVDPSTISRKVSGDRPWRTTEANRVLSFLSKKLRRKVTYEEIFAPEPAAARGARR